MRAVFLDKKTFHKTIALDEISAQFDSFTCFDVTAEHEIITRCQDADVVLTNKVVFDKKTLEQLPKLKLICITATGVNNVDIAAANALGITVTNAKAYAKGSVAQYVFAQLLEYFNQTSHHNANTAKGLWQQSDTFCYLGNTIYELADKTIGIIGYGDLGQSVAQIATAFNMKVMVAERPSAVSIRSQRYAFDEVIKQADIITLHCPQTPETEQLFNRQIFSNMQTHAVLVNTARGALINNDDLIDALNNNDIGYAILDVLDQEPPRSDHPLLTAELTNLKITAHIAWASMEAQQRLIAIVASNISSFFSGGKLNQVT
ncbi:D-2-hydroxyacid dehydrogenase [Thalassotalea sp. PLHSN55]|uniref:D-2-hydroxyacid dehydrogenase n=1 Tax=Thalassotalea sp. PLHSN55 TaxID=3435888 RepID=UPI003F8409EB